MENATSKQEAPDNMALILSRYLQAVADTGGMLSSKSWQRKAEDFGDICLSVQASEYSYSDPRESGLPITDYKSVEVGFLFKNHLRRPSFAGIHGFDELFEDIESPVAGYVSLADVARLREAIVQHVRRGDRPG